MITRLLSRYAEQNKERQEWITDKTVMFLFNLVYDPSTRNSPSAFPQSTSITGEMKSTVAQYYAERYRSQALQARERNAWKARVYKQKREKEETQFRKERVDEEIFIISDVESVKSKKVHPDFGQQAKVQDSGDNASKQSNPLDWDGNGASEDSQDSGEEGVVINWDGEDSDDMGNGVSYSNNCGFSELEKKKSVNLKIKTDNQRAWFRNNMSWTLDEASTASLVEIQLQHNNPFRVKIFHRNKINEATSLKNEKSDPGAEWERVLESTASVKACKRYDCVKWKKYVRPLDITSSRALALLYIIVLSMLQSIMFDSDRWPRETRKMIQDNGQTFLRQCYLLWRILKTKGNKEKTNTKRKMNEEGNYTHCLIENNSQLWRPASLYCMDQYLRLEKLFVDNMV